MISIPGIASADRPHSSRRTVLTIAAGVVLVHLAAAVVAGALVVARYLLPPPATFVIKKDLRLDAKDRKHRMNMDAVAALAPIPTFSDRLQSLRPTAMALPDLPALPVSQMVALDPSSMVADQIEDVIGEASANGTAGAGAGEGAGAASGMSFFGVKDSGRSVVIVVDTSNSMFERTSKGMPHRFRFQTIKDEAVRLIASLGINVRFNIVIYEGGSMAFAKSNLPATDSNKKAAQDWIMVLNEDPTQSISSRQGDGPKLMEGGGTRLDTALKQVFGLQPEVVFLITDGEINRGNFAAIPETEMLSIIKDLQNAREEPARIHIIHYLTSVARDEEVRTLKVIARRNGGRFRQIEAESLD